MFWQILRRNFTAVQQSLPSTISWVLVLTLFVGLPSQVALSNVASATTLATVTYNVNGGSGSAPSSQSQSTSGETLTIATYSGLKNGNRFISWNTAADGSGTYYKAGGNYAPTTDLILYAQWMGAYCPEGWTWSEPTCKKTFSGVENYIIPFGFKSLDVIAVGGSGANGAKGVGGKPGKIQASFRFDEGDELRFFPGGSASGTTGGVDSYPNANYNGGNGIALNGNSGGGGAATVVTKNGSATSNIIVIAGGGGGGGANAGCYSQYNPTTSTPGSDNASSNGLTYGSNGTNHGYNRVSGAGGGGNNGGATGGATPAYSCSSGNDNGGLGLGGSRGGNSATGASATVANTFNEVNGVAGSVTLQLTRPTITYNLNGASGTAPVKQIQNSEGAPLEVSEPGVTRTGYTFAGWNTLANAGGTNYAVGSLYDTNTALVLYAKWSSQITFSGNSNTGGSAPAAVTAIGSNPATLATNSGNLTRTGYTFAGWNSAADGTGTSYAVGLNTFVATGDVTLYAQWNSTITYSRNNATGGAAPAAQTAVGQKPLTLQTNVAGGLSRTGYEFAGWNTAADGSGTRYNVGATNYISNGDANLYAYWIPTPDKPVLKQSSDSGSSSTDNITNDSTPEVSVSNLIVGATVTITAYNNAYSAIASCTFTATSTTQSCSISTALTSSEYYFMAKQSLGGATTLNSIKSTPNVQIDLVRPTASVVTGYNPQTISWKNTQTGQVSSDSLGTVYLVRNSVTVSDTSSITSSNTNLWKSVSITQAYVATNVVLTGLLGGTYKAYALDAAGNLGLASTNSMLVYSQANAPTDLVATPGIGTMGPKFDLTWTAPTDTGGGIDSYLVQYSIDGGSTWISFPRNAAPGNSYSVYPVIYETDYLFRISAVNLWGTGTTSSASDVKKVDIPSCSPTTSPNGFTFVFPIGVCAWTVPAGVTSIKVDARGAQGGWGDYAPGTGGQVIGTLTVTPGETLYMYVGDQGVGFGDTSNPLSGRGGFNGGGFGGAGGAGGRNGSGGGGATDIRTSINSVASRVVVAGGGGGTTYQGNSCCRNIGNGGNGGGTTGAQTSTSDGAGGGGGTQSAGGYSYGTAAGAGIGGAGQDAVSPSTLGSGGGGGGYYGGGGGGGPWRTGGGGGSSYVSNGRFTSTTNSQGVNCAPGFLAITVGDDVSQVPPIPNTCGINGDTTPPVVSTAVAPSVNAAGSIITIFYTDVSFLNTNFVPPSLFTVTSGGTNVAVSSITFFNKVLYLNLAQNLKPGATTTIAYSDPTAGNDVYVVQDAFGNDAGSFSNVSIPTSAITVAVPTTPVLAAASDSGTSNSDKNTNDNTPTFSSSSLVVGATVTFTATPSAGSAVTCVITATATTDSCTFTTLSNSTYAIAVKQTSGTVTSGSPTPLTGVVIDTTRPTVALTSTITNGGNFTATVSAPSTTYTITATFSEAVSGLLISEITKDAASTGWSISTSLSASSTSVYTFIASNSQGTGNTAGKLLLRIAEGVAADTAGNTNTATTNDFVINTLIQVTLSNTYGTASPVVGGNVAYAAQTSSGAAITLPGAGTLTRNYHSFAGWSLTTNGNGAVIGSTYTPTVPTTLYSSWTPNTFVVSFDANGGIGSPDSATVSNTYGTTGLAISSTYNRGSLTRTGYTFAGWSASNGGAAVTNPYSPTSSLTLYARWTANSYAITFDSNTATSGTMNNLGITAGMPTALWGNLFVKTGFSFTGWNSAANGKGTPYGEAALVTLYGNTRLYAQWKVLTPGTPTITSVSAGNTSVIVTVAGAGISGSAGAVDSFTVQAYSDAGTLLTGKTCTVLAAASPLSCTVSGLTNLTVYKFKTTAFNSTGSRDDGSGFYISATPAPYTIIYNINGGTSGAISNGSYTLGTPLTLPTPSRNNYTFSGWYDTTTAGTFIGVGGASYSPNSSRTIYARWTGIGYTITYYANGATSGTVPSSGTFTSGGSSYSIAGNTGNLARNGYTFGGWDTSTAGNGTSYAVNASYSTNSNLNLFAKWTPISRSVTYSVTKDSGVIPSGITGKYIGETFTVASSSGFSRSGYSFAGWSDGTNTYAAGATYTVLGTDVTLTAQWIGASYSVTYIANGGSGSLPTQGNLSSGETFTVQSNPLTRNGYSFVAWNDGSANYAAGSIYTIAGANVSLIAQWTATGYTISYQGNGSDGGSAPTTGRYVTGGAPYSVALNSFTKTGFSFTGWKSSTNFDYAPGTGYATSADLVLTAQWAVKVIAISYNVNGGSGSAPSSTNWTYDTVTAKSLDSGSGLTKLGYSFGGWSTSASATTGSLTSTPASNVTYYAVWTPEVYSVSYVANGGSGNGPTETGKTLGSTFTLAAANSFTAPNSGGTFIFAYWSDGIANYSAGSTYLMPAGPVTLSANWIQLFDVTYNANGGATTNGHSQKSDGATIAIGSAATRDGYNFVKWEAQSGELFAPGETTTVSNSRYLFRATWSPIARTVTYDLNGGSGSAPATLTGKTIGQIINLDSTTATTKDGYTFGGWSISGTTYPAGASYTIGNANVSPSAIWNPATYAISYNGNGATSGTVPSAGTFTTGGSYTAQSNSGSLDKSGFTFAGWNTSASGNGSDYAVGATNVTAIADLILYAKWTTTSYSVTYLLNGATSSQPPTSNVQYGSTFTVAAAATQDGKTFTGWSDNTNTYGGGSTYTMGSAPVVLSATWANQLYAVNYSLNGGSGSSAPLQASLSATETFTVQLTTATKSGYSFGGWSNGSNTYQPGSTFGMTASNVALTAIWNVAAPGVPGTPTATPGDGNATIAIVVPSSGGAPTSYLVTASPGGATCNVISPATSCVITGLSNGTSYSFTSSASNATGGSSASAASATISPAGKPGVPTGVTATIGNGAATVSLTPPSITGGPAIISYTMTASPGGASCTINAPQTSCAVSPLSNGTEYTFTATAYNGVAQSDSSTASAAVIPATIPDAPTITSASSSSSGTTTVNFSAPTNTGGSAITGYTIVSDPGGFTCAATANATSCSVTGLSDGVAYTFSAIASNAIGNSTSSSPSSSVTSAGLPNAPSTISGTVGSGLISVSVSGANARGSAITGYTVQAYDSTGTAIPGRNCSITPPATSCNVSGLTNGSSYTFTATTTNGVGDSSESAPSASFTPAGVPSAPTGLTVLSGTGKVNVSWTAPASNGAAITSYTAQAYDEAGNSVTGATCTISAPSTSCDVSNNLDAGVNYTFKVIASNAAGAGSASSASSSAAINAAPSAPRNVTASTSSGSATASWDPPADSRGSAVISYTATAYNSSNNAVGNCNALAPTETCTVTGLSNGSAYTFKVTATNGIGTSIQSSESSPVTPSTVPNAPTSVVASVGDASASVSFTAPVNNGGSSITEYIVYASNGSTSSGSSSPISISGLVNDTSYTFTVKAKNINGESLASAPSAAATPKASLPPAKSNDAEPSGFAYVGSTLTSQVEFSGSPTPTKTYQWQVCALDSDLSSCSDIAGATSATYIPSISDEGKFIRVEVKGSNVLASDVTVTSALTLVINPEIVFNAPTSGLSGTAGSSFVLSVVAAGGVAPFNYTVSSGALPNGLALDATSGQISGTPAAAGTFTFVIRASDSNTATKQMSVTLTIATSNNSPSPQQNSSPEPASNCDSACQAIRDARAAADKAATDAAAKAKADATAKAAADKAAADKAAADAAARAQNSAIAKAAADAAAAVQAAADAAAKASAAKIAKEAADAAAKKAATAIKAAQDAAKSKTGSSSASTNAAAAKAAADAQAAVKAAAAAASAAASAKKQVDISLNLSVTAAKKATDSAAAQRQANAVAAAAKAAAEAAANKAVEDATAAKAKASQAAQAAAEAQAAAVAEKQAAAKAALDAQTAAKAASIAAAAKIVADQAAQKAAADLAKALAEKATQSAKIAEIIDPVAKASAQTALDGAAKKVEELTKVAATTSQEFETRVKEVETTLEAANQAVEMAKDKNERAEKSAQNAEEKVSVASQAAKTARNSTAAATAATTVARSLPTTVKIAPSKNTNSNPSLSNGNGTKATITGLKPGQKIKVTVKVK